MYWYHVAGICTYRNNWQYTEHLIENPGDALNEARQYAKAIISKCKDIEYAVRGEGIDISSEVSDIQSSADDIAGLENKEVVESIDQFNEVAELCKDQFHSGLEASSMIRKLYHQLTEYQKTLPEDLREGLNDLINQAESLDEHLDDTFCHSANLVRLLETSGWSKISIGRVLSFFPLKSRYNAKYLYCEHEEFQSQGSLRFRREKEGVVLWCDGDHVGIEWGFSKVQMDAQGNVWLTTDATKGKLACFEWKDLDIYFADAMQPTPDEIALYGMVNSEAHNLAAMNFCRGALEVF